MFKFNKDSGATLNYLSQWTHEYRLARTYIAVSFDVQDATLTSDMSTL